MIIIISVLMTIRTQTFYLSKNRAVLFHSEDKFMESQKQFHIWLEIRFYVVFNSNQIKLGTNITVAACFAQFQITHIIGDRDRFSKPCQNIHPSTWHALQRLLLSTGDKDNKILYVSHGYWKKKFRNVGKLLVFHKLSQKIY